MDRETRYFHSVIEELEAEKRQLHMCIDDLKRQLIELNATIAGSSEMTFLNELARTINDRAHDKGWWDETHRNDGEKIALMHSELSEVLEELRSGHDRHEVYFNDTKPEGVPIELADCIIRILDYCGEHGIDIDSAISKKLEYNLTRSFKHGNKVF